MNITKKFIQKYKVVKNCSSIDINISFSFVSFSLAAARIIHVDNLVLNVEF